jgi:hypothetical protein
MTKPEAEATRDSDERMQRTAAEALVAGQSVADVIAILGAAGVDEVDAAVLAAEVLTDPVLDVARYERQRYQKLASVMAMQQQMRDLAQPADTVDRRRGLSRRKFLESYYAVNRPVVLEDVCDRWRACDVWSTAYLAEQLGETVVEVMSGRDTDPDYEANAGAHRSQLPFAEYARLVEAAGTSNDIYLVANNKLLESDAAAALWQDIALDRRYLQPKAAKRRTFLWHGPAGTITPLHHDLMNVLFHQVVGWKRFTLVAAAQTPYVYNRRGVFSDVDAKHPDLERHPDYAKAQPLHVSVGPGEALFVPAGWWHHVEALEPSISVSCTAFVYPNDIAWTSPEPPG